MEACGVAWLEVLGLSTSECSSFHDDESDEVDAFTGEEELRPLESFAGTFPDFGLLGSSCLPCVCLCASRCLANSSWCVLVNGIGVGTLSPPDDLLESGCLVPPRDVREYDALSLVFESLDIADMPPSFDLSFSALLGASIFCADSKVLGPATAFGEDGVGSQMLLLEESAIESSAFAAQTFEVGLISADE